MLKLSKLIYLPELKLKFLFDKSLFEILLNKSLLLGPKIPKQIRSSVTSLNSRFFDKYFPLF